MSRLKKSLNVLGAWVFGPVFRVFVPEAGNTRQIRVTTWLTNILTWSAIIGFGLLALCLSGAASGWSKNALLISTVGVTVLGLFGNRIAARWVTAVGYRTRYKDLTSEQRQESHLLAAQFQGVSLVGLGLSQVLGWTIPPLYATAMHVNLNLQQYAPLKGLLSFSTVSLFAATIGLLIMVAQTWKFRGEGLALPPQRKARALMVAVLIWTIFLSACGVIIGSIVLVTLRATGEIVQVWSIIAPVALNILAGIVGPYVVAWIRLGEMPRRRKHLEMVEQMSIVPMLLATVSMASAQLIARLPQSMPWLHSYGTDMLILTGLLLIAATQPWINNLQQVYLAWVPIKAREEEVNTWIKALKTDKLYRLLKRYQENGHMDALYDVLSIQGIVKVLPFQALVDYVDMILLCLLADRPDVSKATRDRRFRRFLGDVQERWGLSKLRQCLESASEPTRSIAMKYLDNKNRKDRSAHLVRAQDWEVVHQRLLMADLPEAHRLWEDLAIDGLAANQYFQGLAHALERSHDFLDDAKVVLVHKGRGKKGGLVSALLATRPEALERLFGILLRHGLEGEEIVRQVCQQARTAAPQLLRLMPHINNMLETGLLIAIAGDSLSGQNGEQDAVHALVDQSSASPPESALHPENNGYHHVRTNSHIDRYASGQNGSRSEDGDGYGDAPTLVLQSIRL